MLAGAGGASRLTPLEIPIINALGLGRESRLGRAALLESVAAAEYAPGAFARALQNLAGKLGALTNRESTSLIEVEGSGKGTTYRLSDSLLFSDGDDLIDLLVAQATKKLLTINGIKHEIIRFPERDMREPIFNRMLHEHANRPRVTTQVGQLLEGLAYEVTAGTGVKLFKYPRLSGKRERELLLNIEKGLLAYTGLSDAPRRGRSSSRHPTGHYFLQRVAIPLPVHCGRGRQKIFESSAL